MELIFSLTQSEITEKNLHWLDKLATDSVKIMGKPFESSNLLPKPGGSGTGGATDGGAAVARRGSGRVTCHTRSPDS